MAEYGGSSTYAPGSSTTTVQTRPGAYDPTEALLALLARERTTLDNRIPAAAPVAPAPRLAAAPVPVQQPMGQTQTRAAASALAARAPAPKQYEVWTMPTNPFGGGSVTAPNGGTQARRVAPGTPGARFSGYASADFDPSLTAEGTGMDVFQQGKGGSNNSSGARGAPEPTPFDSTAGGGSDFDKARMANALTRSNAEYAARNGGR